MKNVFKHKINFMQIWSEHNWVRNVSDCVYYLYVRTYIYVYGFDCVCFSFCLNILIENYNNVDDLRCVLLCVWLWPEVINGFNGVVMNVFYVLSVSVFRGFYLTKERIVSDNRWLNTLVTIKIALGYIYLNTHTHIFEF